MLRRVDFLLVAERQNLSLSGLFVRQQRIGNIRIFWRGNVGYCVFLAHRRVVCAHAASLVARGGQFRAVVFVEHLELDQARITVRDTARLILVLLRVAVDDPVRPDPDQRLSRRICASLVCVGGFEPVGDRAACGDALLNASLDRRPLAGVGQVVTFVAQVGTDNLKLDAVGI